MSTLGLPALQMGDGGGGPVGRTACHSPLTKKRSAPLWSHGFPPTLTV